MAFPAGSTKSLVTIHNAKISGSINFTDLPVLITGANVHAAVFAAMQGDGDDIRFTSDEDGATELAFEIVSLDAGAETCEIWVKIPDVADDADTLFYMWFGDAALSAYAIDATYGAENVWVTGNGQVLHLSDNGLDSSANDKDGTARNITYQDGAFGREAVFNGDADFAFGANLFSNAQIATGTILAYVRLNSPTVDDVIWTSEGWMGIEIDDGTDKIQAHSDGIPTLATSAAAYADASRHLIVMTWDGTNTNLYVDDASVVNVTPGSSPPVDNSSRETILGADWNNSREMTGEIGEFRILTGVLKTAAWVLTQNNMFSSPSTFLTVAEPISGGGAGFMMMMMGVG